MVVVIVVVFHLNVECKKNLPVILDIINYLVNNISPRSILAKLKPSIYLPVYSDTTLLWKEREKKKGIKTERTERKNKKKMEFYEVITCLYIAPCNFRMSFNGNKISLSSPLYMIKA